MATILDDPNDPALSSSYEDGVERARRVNLKKKKPLGVGDTTPPPLSNTLQEGELSLDNQVALAGGPNSWWGSALLDQRKTKKISGQSTILGG